MNHEDIKRYFENNPPPKEVRLETVGKNYQLEGFPLQL